MRCDKHKNQGFTYCNLCEVEMLREWTDNLCQALHEYGDHGPSCKVHRTEDNEDCDCGYNDAFEMPESSF